MLVDESGMRLDIVGVSRPFITFWLAYIPYILSD